jgi:hypothetical protein
MRVIAPIASENARILTAPQNGMSNIDQRGEPY